MPAAAPASARSFRRRTSLHQEQRLVALPEEFRKFRREPRRDQRVEQRSQHDKDRGAAGFADDFMASEQLEHRRHGGKSRKPQKQGGQHQAFETVQRSGLRCGNGFMAAFPARTMRPVSTGATVRAVTPVTRASAGIRHIRRPDGLSGKSPLMLVKPSTEKYSLCVVGQISGLTPAILSRQRGVGHRRKRWGRLRWTRQRRRGRGLQGGLCP